MTPNKDLHLPEVYHPNAVDLHIEEVRQSALQQLGLGDGDNLSTEQAAQVGQAMAEQLEALQANVNQQSE
ncbi:hypothetical protein [Tumebacillus permanentifrigoris]|uniref:Uncharacterized protein n=1 Tax=Tumebacillus permanentifrigoris TaxID=378543 RepID=A0A316D6Z6_9BACL|nr:hypothetical protein [Tumebacillus permanentifrigoris]PWK05098.1 hypothetical protein C7459_12730 [Tumebacillus permanentifrigoris]